MDARRYRCPRAVGRVGTAIQPQRRMVVVTPDLLQYSQPQRTP